MLKGSIYARTNGKALTPLLTLHPTFILDTGIFGKQHLFLLPLLLSMVAPLPHFVRNWFYGTMLLAGCQVS
jgi:hypothetical protein